MDIPFKLLNKCNDCFKSHAKKPMPECKKCINGSRFKGSCKSCLFYKNMDYIEDIFTKDEFCTNCLKNECLFTLNVYPVVF